MRRQRILTFVVVAAVAAASLVSCAAATAQLPDDDSARHYLLVFEVAGGPIQTMIQVDARLGAIAERCHYLQMDAANPLYQSRYSTAIPPDRLPAVALARADGGVIYLATGDHVPRSAGQLYDEIIAAAVAAREQVPGTDLRPDTTRPATPGGSSLRDTRVGQRLPGGRVGGYVLIAVAVLVAVALMRGEQ